MPAPFDRIIDEIEAALFEDTDELGCRDTEDGYFLITEIGRIRLRKILKKFSERCRKPTKK